MLSKFWNKTNDHAAREAAEGIKALTLLAKLQKGMDALDIPFSVYDENDTLIFWNKNYQFLYQNVWHKLEQPFTYQTLVRTHLQHEKFSGDIEAEVRKRTNEQHQTHSMVDRAYPTGANMRVIKIRSPEGICVATAMDISDIKAREKAVSDWLAAFEADMNKEIENSCTKISTSSANFVEASNGLVLSAQATSSKATIISNAAIETSSSLQKVSTEAARTANASTKASASVSDTEAQFALLSQAMERIASFATTIQAIADQTNLLALNATIEAARAGEAGRGFAVVAAEVKSLSDQTTGATEEINSQIKNVLDVMRRSETAISDIATSIADISGLSDTAAQSVDQQAGSVQEIVHEMNSLNQMAVQNSTSAKNVAELAKEMNRNAEDLRSTFQRALSNGVSRLKR